MRDTVHSRRESLRVTHFVSGHRTGNDNYVSSYDGNLVLTIISQSMTVNY